MKRRDFRGCILQSKLKSMKDGHYRLKKLVASIYERLYDIPE